MHIGFDAKRYFNNFTGLGNYSRNLVNSIIRNFPGYDYHLYTPKINRERTYPNLKNDNIKIISPKNSLSGSFWRFFELSSILKKDKIDVYHGLSHELPSGLNKKGIKSVVTIHDVIFKRYPEQYPFVDRLIYDFKWKNSCKSADKIIAISENTKQDIIEYYEVEEEKIEVIYQGCDEHFYEKYSEEQLRIFKQKYDLPEEYFLYVGSVIERKKLLQIIRAMNELPESVQIPLVIIGRGGDYEKRVREYIRTNGMEKKVIWPSDFEYHDLPKLYQGAQFLVYPSVYEGFGIPIIEAYASGIPVLTSHSSCLPEIAGSGAIYINPDDIDNLKSGMLSLMESEDLRRKLIIQGRSQLVNFDNDEIAKEVVKLYESIIR